MEKENKDIIENTEQNENSGEQNKQAKRKKTNIKKILFIALGITLVLCLGIFISFKIYTTELHVYEEVENLGEREGVCFDNLLFSYCIAMDDNSSEKWNNEYLCIFNTGDIYCFEWSKLDSWDWYYYDSEDKRGYDDTNWSRTENVIYLGRLSNWEIARLSYYVKNYDVDGKYYNVMETYSMEEPDSNEEVQQAQEQFEEQNIWRSYLAKIYWHEQPLNKFFTKDGVIIYCYMNDLGDYRYEKGEILWKSYDENALAALELFESSGFYDIWVDMCLNNR